MDEPPVDAIKPVRRGVEESVSGQVQKKPRVNWIAVALILFLVAGGVWYLWDDHKDVIIAEEQEAERTAARHSPQRIAGEKKRGEELYDKIQELYKSLRSIEDCSQIRRTVRSMNRYTELYWLTRDLTFWDSKRDQIVQSAFDPLMSFAL